MNTLQTALQLQAAGISVVPVATDGSKRPAGNWKEYQTIRATTLTIDGWFSKGDAGVGVVTGAVSGGLEMAEIEGRGAERIPELAGVAADNGLGHLWAKLCTGWLEQSPSGGLHWFYRVKWPEGHKPPGNTKIASRPSTATELAGNPRQKRQVIAETRGEGGYVVTSPSAGTVHPSGKPWVRIAGGPDTLPVLTPDEREMFHTILATLHQPDPEPAEQEQLAPVPRTTDIDGITPGDDYENKTDWKDILEPAGWTLVTTRGRTRYWRRPGKSIGFSATTGHAEDRDRLFVWTSSTEFEQETPYTKFGAYALLVHGGNHSDAASALRKAGHGAPLPLERPTTLTPFIPPLQATAPPATSDAPATPNLLQTSPKLGATATEGTAALATVHQLPTIKTTQSRTDYGNSQLFITLHGHHLRYAPSRGAWLQWDGNRWAFQEDDGPAVQHMWETVLSIDRTSQEAANHQERSLSRRSLEAAVALARRNPEIRVTADQLDAHPYELNTPAGIIDLRTGELMPPDPAKLHTKITGVTYDPNATAPKWEAFLNTTFDGDQQMCDYIQRLAGYSAAGIVTEHVLPFLVGEGGNGKGQFMEVMLAIFGDYGTTAPGNFLMAGRDRHETEIARLAGMRFVVCSEINLGAKFDEAKVKLLTGGDKLTARFMNQNHFSFIPAHTMWLMANHKPTIAAGGESFFRRIRTLLFTHTIPEEKKIPGLSGMLLEEEGPGILNWIIAGAIDALKNGMRAPASVMAATHLYAEEEDGFARFISDRCTLGPAAAFRVDTATMRREYSNWCREQGETELSPQQFGRDLKARYDVQQIRSNGRRFYAGITVFTHHQEQPEHWSDR